MINKRIKVLIILEATLGGTRKHVVDLLKNINKDKFEITFLYSLVRADSNFYQDLDELKKTDVELIEIPMVRSAYIFKNIKALKSIRGIIKGGNFDILHCHSTIAGGLGRLATLKTNSKLKVIYTPNALSVHLNKLYGIVEKTLSLITDSIIAVSDSEKLEIIENQIIHEKKIHKINSGVEIPDYLTKSGIKDKDKDKLVIGTIGRLSPQKDPITFFNAMFKILKIYPNLQIKWIGDGEMRVQVDSLLNEFNIQDSITITGWLNDITDELNDIDIFVLTSTYESFGYVTCEAMALGKPIVATDVAGTRDLVENNVNGKLVPVGNVKFLVQEIKKLIEDNELREKYGHESRERAKKYFSLDGMVLQTENLYLDLIS